MSVFETVAKTETLRRVQGAQGLVFVEQIVGSRAGNADSRWAKSLAAEDNRGR